MAPFIAWLMPGQPGEWQNKPFARLPCFCCRAIFGLEPRIVAKTYFDHHNVLLLSCFPNLQVIAALLGLRQSVSLVGTSLCCPDCFLIPMLACTVQLSLLKQQIQITASQARFIASRALLVGVVNCMWCCCRHLQLPSLDSCAVFHVQK